MVMCTLGKQTLPFLANGYVIHHMNLSNHNYHAQTWLWNVTVYGILPLSMEEQNDGMSK